MPTGCATSGPVAVLRVRLRSAGEVVRVQDRLRGTRVRDRRRRPAAQRRRARVQPGRRRRRRGGRDRGGRAGRRPAAVQPRQARLAQLLGLPVPTYGHVPLVIGPDGERLAKRHGAVTLRERAAAGATPAQTLSLLAASAGLAEPARSSRPALVPRFDPDRLPRSPWRI